MVRIAQQERTIRKRTPPRPARQESLVIQSLARGLDILDFIAAQGGEVSVTEAARFLGVDRSTSSRLLSTLAERGFVDQDITLRYRLGTKLLQLSNALLESLNLGVIGHQEVRALAEETGEGAQLAILVGTQAAFIDHVDGRERLTINTNIGDHDPLYCTAIGRALLSGLPDGEVRELLSRVRLERFTRNTVVSIDEVIDRLRRVRNRGVAFDDEERHHGVQCYAAPVFDHTGNIVAAIGISGPTHRMIRAGEEALSGAVRAAGQQLSTALGYTPHRSTAAVAPIARALR
jgi:IclR family transcriptional regulator, KDG regulon repressor